MKKAVLVVALMLVMIFYGCANKQEVKLGFYAPDDASLASLTLLDDNEFSMAGPIFVSYAPYGTYEIKGDKLYLSPEESVFLVDGDKLILKSGAWLENWIEPGTVFYFLGEPLE